MYSNLTPPSDGDIIRMEGSELRVPDRPIIPFIEGDGIGPDIWAAAQNVFDNAVDKAYDGNRRIVWFEVFAGATGSGNGCPRTRSRRSAITSFRSRDRSPRRSVAESGR